MVILTLRNEVKSKGSIRRILKYVFKYKYSVFMILIFSILESLIAVFSPKISGKGITALCAVDANGNSNIDLNYIFNLLAFLLVLYSVSGFLSCIGRYLFTNVSVKIVYNLRKEISDKMNNASFEYIQNRSQGDILSCIVSDAENISSAFIESVRGILSSFIIAIGTIYMMFSISWEMSLCAFALLPIVGVLIVYFAGKSQKYYKGYRENLGKLNNIIGESFYGYETIKSFGAEDEFVKKFSTINKNLNDEYFESNFISGLMSPIMTFLSKVLYVICCVLGGYLAVVRGLLVGDITAFIVYCDQFVKPFIGISGALGEFQSTYASAQRVFDFLDAPEELEGGNAPKNNASIEFKNVSFEYTENKPVIKNLSFKWELGKTIAIVGETGSGKTTVSKLIMRFYEPTSGEIFLGNSNIKDIDINDYRKLFAVVTQDSWLYTSSIIDNIKYGNLEATEEEVKEAAKIVGIDKFVKSLPEGYETIVSGNLSEGQKELICIARAVVSNREFLIMDEATACVDTVTESFIQKSLNKILSQKTSLIIAHRLSTVKNADIILVMNSGEVCEFGNHKELMAKKGRYYEMYKNLI